MSLLAAACSRIPRRSLRLSSIRRLTATQTRSVKTEPAYQGHIPLNWFENAFLAVGSAVMSLADPRRAGRHGFNYFCFHH
jgi:ubiquinone biosynthesis protein COQ4